MEGVNSFIVSMLFIFFDIKLYNPEFIIYITIMDSLKQNARFLRKNMTPQERKLWQIIRNRQFYGLKFLRQYVLGKYIVDFICMEKKIIIELDGGQHNEDKNIIYDQDRTEYLKAKGFTVVRFWNNEIDNNIDGVYLELESVMGIV